MSLNPAPQQLAEFAAASRPDWDRDRIDGAFQAARTNGVPWPRFLAIFWTALTDEQATPRAILDAIRSPVEKAASDPPNAAFTTALDALAGRQP